MGLSELVSHLELWVYPVVGLLGFCLAFLIQAVRVSRTSRAEMDRCGNLPLDDGAVGGARAAANRGEDGR